MCNIKYFLLVRSQQRMLRLDDLDHHGYKVSKLDELFGHCGMHVACGGRACKISDVDCTLVSVMPEGHNTVLFSHTLNQPSPCRCAQGQMIAPTLLLYYGSRHTLKQCRMYFCCCMYVHSAFWALVNARYVKHTSACCAC